MVTIRKSEMDPSAQAYLPNSVQNVLRPYTSGNAPANTNTGRLTDLNYRPPEAYPSRFLNGNIRAQHIKELMLALASYYSSIGRGRYGLRNTDSETNRTWYTGEGSGYFALAGMNNGIVSRASGVPLPKGNVNHARASDIYGYAWNQLQSAVNTSEADLTVCHSSCHTSCHGSRGRR